MTFGELFVAEGATDSHPRAFFKDGWAAFELDGEGHHHGVGGAAGHESAIEAQAVLGAIAVELGDDLTLGLDLHIAEDSHHGFVARGEEDLAERKLEAAVVVLGGGLF